MSKRRYVNFNVLKQVTEEFKKEHKKSDHQLTSEDRKSIWKEAERLTNTQSTDRNNERYNV